tara:strand:- start:147 stop:440 length:294 start_codon:yes stop_codon:yes gene_type:complete
MTTYNTKSDRLLNRIKKSVGVGGCGAIYIDDTDTKTGSFSAITAVGTADAVLAHATSASDITGFDANITIPKGVTIFGNFTAIDLVSGAVIAYNTCG